MIDINHKSLLLRRIAMAAIERQWRSCRRLNQGHSPDLGVGELRNGRSGRLTLATFLLASYRFGASRLARLLRARDIQSIVRAACLTAAFQVAVGKLTADDAADFYVHKIKPILAERCYSCHGALKQEGGLRLDTAAMALAGGDSGAAVEPGDLSSSVLVERITSSEESLRMPQEGVPLKSDEIKALELWIKQGAQFPKDEQPEVDPSKHWAFQVIQRPEVPKRENPNETGNSIDAFVAKEHAEHGLTPKEEAPREVLIRRLYIDLIGVPPSQEELSRLEDDRSPDWYERLVARLLDDPRHGERWARHWMDIWRYSDWWGLNGEVRYSQRHMWRWRDWIVDSLNSNVPYDEMVRCMLAADELYPTDLTKLAATGFLARNFYVFGRTQWLEETVEHVGKGMLGLTFNCAKCHDHKYDPIEQVDYYRMRAFFEPYHVRVDVVPGQSDLVYDGVPRVFDGALDAPTYLFERGQEGSPDKSKLIEAGVPKILPQEQFAIHPVSLPKEVWQPERRPWVLDAYATNAKDRVAGAEAALAPIMEKLAIARKHFRKLKKVAEGEATRASEADAAKAEADRSELSVAEAAITDVKAELHAASQALEFARADLLSVDKRGKAMRAEWAAEEGSPTDAKDLTAAANAAIEAAVKAERRAAYVKTLQAVSDIELRLVRASPDAKAAIEAELLASRELRSNAEQKIAEAVRAGDRFAPLVGAVWSATKHIQAQAFDPPLAFPSQSTGRRTALAAWITDKSNPLTARVAVNHIWARHMGTPLVSSVFDFGRKGAQPTHPELLDWLATELIESGWDMKHLHRLIVESSTYRMSSSAVDSEANLAIDPDNRYLWRRLPVRLESQVVRDAILTHAATIDLTRGGPSVPAWAQAESRRRSLYFTHASDDRNTFLTMFDEASVNECYRRDQSIIPQQALALSNSGFVLDAMPSITTRLSEPAKPESIPLTDAEFVKKAYYVLLGIRANENEIAAGVNAMNDWRKLPEATANTSEDLGRRYLVWALINHTDFVTVR